MMALGLSGFAGAGKTTAARYIEENYGFKRLHIGEPIRAMLAVLMRANGISDAMIDRYLIGDLKDGVVIPQFGRTSRDMQITLGTNWGRRLVNDGLWLNTWVHTASDHELVMNDSIRFMNEEDAIRDMNGLTIMIERKGKGPAKFKGRWGKWLYEVTGRMWGVDDSERTDRLDPDFIVKNDGDVETMYRTLDEIMMIYGVEKRT